MTTDPEKEVEEMAARLREFDGKMFGEPTNLVGMARFVLADRRAAVAAVVERAAEAITAERVEEVGPGDDAYNFAIECAVKAVRRLSPQGSPFEAMRVAMEALRLAAGSFEADHQREQFALGRPIDQPRELVECRAALSALDAQIGGMA